MTNRDFLNKVAELAKQTDNKEICDKALELIAKLDERNAKRASTPSKVAKENAPIKKQIAELLADGKKRTSPEIGEMLNISTAKASALCRQLVEAEVIKSEEVKVPKKGKMKAYFIG